MQDTDINNPHGYLKTGNAVKKLELETRPGVTGSPQKR
jgi:hypothetical protein